MKRTIKTFLVICCLAICLLLCLTACGNKCEHIYDNACDITCNECGEERTISHDWNDATCLTPKTCKVCGATDGEALGHTPEDDDNDCTTALNCGVCGTTTTPAKNHTGGTATCTEKAECTACGTAYGTLDTNNHIDENTDHICDRECGKTDMGIHADTNNDHICEYGCTTSIGTHADTNNDHICEYGCTISIGTHADSDEDNDHVCDYGCGATLEDCKGCTATCVSGKVCEICGVEYDLTKNSDNHDLTTVDDNGVCGCGQVLTFVITNSGVTTNYDNFADALAAWTDGTTLTLFSDVTGLTERIKTYANGLILDLNGHKIECSDTLCTIWIDGDSGSELTIRDSKGGGYIQGTVYAVGSGVSTSTLHLEGGMLQNVSANGNFIMTGGTIRNEGGSAIGSTGIGNEIIISGGEIYGSISGIWNSYGAAVTITGTVKIISAGDFAIFTSNTVISGTPTIIGSEYEFYLNGKITLNTQPADGEVWRARIDTGDITDGIFAIPGEGITLDVSKFASAMDGYEVKQNDKGELLLCNHAVSYYAVANGDGTHNMTCYCGGTVLETNLACSGGMATDTLLALCQYCGVAYGELDPNVHYDIYTANMTAEELQAALTELLLAGQTEISIFLADGDTKMLAAIDAALNSSGVDKDSVKLTFGSQNTVQNEKQLTRAFENGGIITLTADITLTNPAYVNKNTTIILNGRTLTPGVLGLGVERGCTLTVIGDGIVNGGEGLWVFNGTLNLQGGTVDYLSVNETVSTANISGGKFTTLDVAFGGTANISGGEVTTLGVVDGGTANISGGYVGELYNFDGNLIITGGTFGVDPTEYLAEGYTATYNETDGIWTVTQNN